MIRGLVYATDRDPGIHRQAVRGDFRFISAAGRPLTSPRQLRRIQSLVIPPAWRDVWICPNPRGHIQATGRDERGRKQYIYHPLWRTSRDQAKFDSLVAFAQRLGPLRQIVNRDLRRPALGREKVLAAVVSLLQATLIRIGNKEYVHQNGSYGLTTLRNRHVEVKGIRARFSFRGKSGVEHAIDLKNPRLAAIIKACQELPGQELFQYEDDDGVLRPVTSADVNEYVRQAMGQEFTAKEFRTWAATVLTAAALRDVGPPASATQAKRNVAAAIALVAARLGNTRTVCRQCYVHPQVIDAYLNGRLPAWRPGRRRSGLSADERAVYRLLRQTNGRGA